MSVQSDAEALAAAAKERGNKAFAKKTREGYEEAVQCYSEAIGHMDGHVFRANRCAAELELAKDEYVPYKKALRCCKALDDAQRCTGLSPEWAKGWVRRATSELDLLEALQKWAQRKKEDAEWASKSASAVAEEVQELPAELALVAEGAKLAQVEASCRAGLKLEQEGPQALALLQRLQQCRDQGWETSADEDAKLRDPEAAAPFKQEGNRLFAQKQFTDAAKQYTEALARDPLDHVFYSNRSGSYAEAFESEKALRDAEQCLRLKPDFAKGYSRKAVALYQLGRYVDMEASVVAGLKVDAESQALKDLLRQAKQETSEPPEVQKLLHQFRTEKRQNQKLQEVLKGLNMQSMGGPGGVQVFGNGLNGGGLGDLLGGLGGGGGGLGGGMNKANMTEEQMRGMARAMASAPAPATEPPTVAGAYPQTGK